MSKLSDWFNSKFRPRTVEHQALVVAVDDAINDVIRRMDAGEDLATIIPRLVYTNEPEVQWSQVDQSWTYTEKFSAHHMMPVGKTIIFEEGRGGMAQDTAKITSASRDEENNSYVYLIEFTTAEAPA